MLVLLLGCDEGLAPSRPAPPPPPVPVVIADAAPVALLGAEPATLGPAFDGLALGQAIDQAAADQWLKQRGLPATAYVRDGHLVSLAVRGAAHWQIGDFRHWVSAHQHATEVVTEQGSWVQFDLEVPIEQWLSSSLQSIVPTDLVAKPLEDVEQRIHVRTYSNYVDGYAHTSWTDSALAGAVTATNLTVAEAHAFKKTRQTADGGWEIEDQGIASHELDVDLDGSRALYDAIDHRVTELFGHSKKIKLTHSPAGDGVEHIELVWQR